jgi:hypothetical protein
MKALLLITRSILSTLLLKLMLLCINACTTDEHPPLPKLETIGFSGTLPDGRTFGTTAIEPSNGIVASSSSEDGSYISHVFSILDPAEGISLMVELPYIKYSDSYHSYQEGNDSITQQAIKEYYPYQVVKEKLSVGHKFILSSQYPDKTNSFRIQMVDEKTYLAYTTEHMLDQNGSYLKVKQIIEGMETDPVLGKVKKIEVVFEVDAKLYSYNKPSAQPKKLKGLLRMKYLEK